MNCVHIIYINFNSNDGTPYWQYRTSASSLGSRWPSELERWLGLATGRSRPGSNPAAKTSLRNFGNSVYLALPVSFGVEWSGVEWIGVDWSELE